MKWIVEDKLSKFQFWSGAANHAEELTDHQMEMLDDILMDLYPEGIENVQLNDLFWFEFDYVKSLLGLDSEEDNYEDE